MRALTGLSHWFDRRGWRDLIIGLPYVWLLVLFLLPFLIVLAMSVATRTPTAPPFGFGGENPWLNFEGYARLFTDDLYIRSFLTSLMNAGLATVFCLALGYPMALGLTRISAGWRGILLMLVILPFWTSFLLRVYALSGFLRGEGVINNVLGMFGIGQLTMMQTNFAVVLVMVYTYLPFMILPLYANLERLDRALDEAAMDLGSRPFRVFLDVTLPQSVPGIIAGGLLVFIPAAGELVIPTLVGDAGMPMIGRVISDEFSSARDWPMASSVAVVLLILMVGPTILYSRFNARAEGSTPLEAQK